MSHFGAFNLIFLFEVGYESARCFDSGFRCRIIFLFMVIYTYFYSHFYMYPSNSLLLIILRVSNIRQLITFSVAWIFYLRGNNQNKNSRCHYEVWTYLFSFGSIIAWRHTEDISRTRSDFACHTGACYLPRTNALDRRHGLIYP